MYQPGVKNMKKRKITWRGDKEDRKLQKMDNKPLK
jgi:hypothetical protein